MNKRVLSTLIGGIAVLATAAPAHAAPPPEYDVVNVARGAEQIVGSWTNSNGVYWYADLHKVQWNVTLTDKIASDSVCADGRVVITFTDGSKFYEGLPRMCGGNGWRTGNVQHTFQKTISQASFQVKRHTEAWSSAALDNNVPGGD